MKIYFKTLIGLFLFSSLAHARPFTAIDCSAVDRTGISVKFKFNGFDDKYSFVTVFKDNKKLFSIKGDTTSNPCLEVGMSAGAGPDDNDRDIIAIFRVHEMEGCRGPFNTATLAAHGKLPGKTMSGELTIRHKSIYTRVKVKCLVIDFNEERF